MAKVACLGIGLYVGILVFVVGTKDLAKGPEPLCISAVFWAIAFPAVVSMLRGLTVGATSQQGAEEKPANIEQLDADYPPKRRWNSLYYCSYCKGVFIPGDNRFVPLEQMQAFLSE